MEGRRSLTGLLAVSPAFAGMGEPLERVRRELMARGRDLAEAVEPAYAAPVGEALRYLEAQSCRVAVIGQVKAGKSSFINALVGRPGLLPSDVNPWTTVVTNLHFYQAPQPAESAVFSFFDNDEWGRLAESGGMLRDLTERLVPGFSPDLLRSQLHSMRLRAEQRLGPSFATLLGQRHTYPAVAPDVLARYVSAGGQEVAIAGESWLSDITKTADLFFGSERTGFPVTLVDTPGTNDPLLVRDEITRQSLGSADIYVVVLTAQQPLAIGDLALLRLLRGLHKERIVIFVNRIDGIGDIAGGTRRIVEHVEARLAEEFGQGRLPIVVGSARWANAALGGDPAEIASLVGPQLKAFAVACGLPEPRTPVAGRPLEAETLATLLVLSGLPTVTQAVGRLMAVGNAAHATRQIATFFHELARTVEATGRAEVRAIDRALDERRATSASRSGDLARWQQELGQLQAAGQQLEANLAVYEQSLTSLVERCQSDLDLLLGRTVERFTVRQVQSLTEAYRRNAVSVWQCNSAPLRDELQAEFLRVYRYWEGKLLQADQLIRAQLAAVMVDGSVEGAAAVTEAPPAPTVRYPDVSALGKVVALDLAAPWWIAWWRGRPALESRSRELEALIASEFAGLVRELRAVAARALGEHAQHAARQARVGTLDIVNGIHRRSSELVGELQQAEGTSSPAALAGLEQQLRAGEARLERVSGLRAALSNLVQACENLSQRA